MAGWMPRPRTIRRRFTPTTICRRAVREGTARGTIGALMVRDARRCRAPHHEDLKPHPEEARSAVSKDESPRRCRHLFDGLICMIPATEPTETNQSSAHLRLVSDRTGAAASGITLSGVSKT